jgi:hypothetical protein
VLLLIVLGSWTYFMSHEEFKHGKGTWQKMAAILLSAYGLWGADQWMRVHASWQPLHNNLCFSARPQCTAWMCKHALCAEHQLRWRVPIVAHEALLGPPHIVYSKSAARHLAVNVLHYILLCMFNCQLQLQLARWEPGCLCLRAP